MTVPGSSAGRLSAARGTTAAVGAERAALYTRLVNANHSAIYNYVLRMVADPGLAEDLTQESYLRAYRGIDRLPADANHRAWLFRIATNATTDEIRRRRRRPTEVFGLSSTLRASGEAEDARLGRFELQDALAQLELRHAKVLHLFEFAGLSAPEVAEVLGIRPEAARKRRQRARAALAQILDGGGS